MRDPWVELMGLTHGFDPWARPMGSAHGPAHGPAHGVQKRGPPWKYMAKQSSDFQVGLAIWGACIGLSWWMICSKSRIKAWGWVPRLFFAFETISEFSATVGL